MKVLKGLAITFVLSVTAACVGVQADDYLGLIGITIPKKQVEYVSKTVKKTQHSDEYVRSRGTTPNRRVRAQVNNTNGDHGKYYTLAPDGCSKVTGTDSVGTNPGSYKLKLQTVSYHTSTTEYTGTWVLDEELMINSKICN